MRIFIIRHGESTSDIDNLYGGYYDDHLTEEGKDQAKKLADKLAGRGIQIIFSSPFKRAKETSDILKKSLNCDLRIVKDIRERNSYGFLTGTSKDEAKIKHPDLVEKLNDYRFSMQNGEDYENFTKRIGNAFNKITKSGYKKIAIVSHGGSIRCLFRTVLNFGEFTEELGDCAIIELEKNDSSFKVIKMDGASFA